MSPDRGCHSFGAMIEKALPHVATNLSGQKTSVLEMASEDDFSSQ